MTSWQLCKPDTLVIGLFHDSAVCYNRETRDLSALSFAAGQILVCLKQNGVPMGLVSITDSLMDGEGSNEDLGLVEACLLQMATKGWVQQVGEAGV